jgi:hypothetical protein
MIGPLSKFAFNFNLRRYIAAGWQQRKLTVAVLGAGVQAGF